MPSENAGLAQVVIDRGNTAKLTPSPTQGPRLSHPSESKNLHTEQNSSPKEFYNKPTL